MNLSREQFNELNMNKQQVMFEWLCIKYFFKLNKCELWEELLINENQAAIETFPIVKKTKWIQSKFYTNNGNKLKSDLKESFTEEKLSKYPLLKEITVITNINANCDTMQISEINSNIKRNITIKILNWKTFLNRLSQPQYNDLQYEYFWKNNLWWFFVEQQPKYNDLVKNWIIKKDIKIVKVWEKKKIKLDDFLTMIMDNKWKIYLLEWKPASWKSLLLSYYVNRLSKEFKSLTNFFPICVKLSNLDCNLIKYISEQLGNYTEYNINGFSKIILFLDGWNELTDDRFVFMKNEIESLFDVIPNLFTVIITSRLWSIKTYDLHDLKIEKYEIHSTYKFKIEDYIKSSLKNLDKIDILEPKQENLVDFLWNLAKSTDYYSEKSHISIKSFQNSLNAIWINDTKSKNDILKLLINAWFFSEIDNKIYFNDQKIYEYLFVKKISKNFLKLLPKLRDYNFFYKYDLKQFLCEEILNWTENFIDLFIRRLFVSRLINSSLENNGWWSPYSEVFLYALLNLNWSSILLNENNNIKKIIENYYLDYKTVCLLKEKWEFRYANEIKKKYTNFLSHISKERDEFYENNKNNIQTLNMKRHDLNFNNAYINYHYWLENRIWRINEKSLRKQLKHNWFSDEYVLMLIDLLIKNRVKTFIKYFSYLNDKNLLKKFLVSVSRFENLYLLDRIPRKILIKLLNIYSLKQIVSHLEDNNYLSQNDENMLSWLIVFFINKKKYWIRILKNTKEKIASCLNKYLNEVKWVGLNWKLNSELKLLLVLAFSDDTIIDIFQLIKEDISHYTARQYLIKSFLKRYIDKQLVWINNYPLLEVYLIFLDAWNNRYYKDIWLENLNNILLYSIFKKSIDDNTFNPKWIEILIDKKLCHGTVLDLITKIITSWWSWKFSLKIIKFLWDIMSSESSISRKSEYYPILTYISNNQWSNQLALYYFYKSLNNSYIRYWWRKDYFMDDIIDSIDAWIRNFFLSEDDVLKYCLDIWEMYENLINCADWKWVAHIPRRLFKIVSNLSLEKRKKFKDSFWDWKWYWYHTIWQFEGLLERISKYEEYDSLKNDISSLYISYYPNRNCNNTIKLILFSRLWNMPYYRINYEWDITDEINKLLNWIENILDIKEELRRIQLDSESKKQFYADFKNIEIALNLQLESDFYDEEQLYSAIWLIKPIKFNELNFEDEGMYEKILDMDEWYNIMYNSYDEICLFLDNLKKEFNDNYMDKLVHSNLFRSLFWREFLTFKNLSIEIWYKIYSLNPSKFQELVRYPIKYIDKYDNVEKEYYFVNIPLACKILIEDKNNSWFKSFIDWLIDLWKLMVY